jgi:tetratricopeptide (TPR) repeat protein
LREAIRIASANDLSQALLRAQFNFSGLLLEHDRLIEAREILVEGLAHSRLRGDRAWESNLIGQLGEVLVLTGEWEEATRILDLNSQSPTDGMGTALRLEPLIDLYLARGQLAEARTLVDQASELAESTDLQTQAIFFQADSEVCLAEGRYDEALEIARRAFEIFRALNQPHYEVLGYSVAIDAAIGLRDVENAERLLHEIRSIPAVERRSLVDAQTSRLEGKIEALRGGDPSDAFARAEALFREIPMPYWLAVTLSDAADAGITGGADEARSIFERLGARLWIAHLDRVGATT